MRAPLIAGNWKMHHGVAASQSFLEALINQDLPAAVDVVVCPPFVSLPVAAMLTAGSPIALGAQNVHWETAGAFTGEISAPMLIELGVRWAIVGHSERRSLFGETDEHTIRRARTAQDGGLGVILCIGESLAQREGEQTFDVLEGQIAGIDRLDPRRLVVAYEPVWAIGTGHNATPTQAQEVHAFLRDRLTATYGPAEADALRILYGGSLKPSNARELLAQPDVDGGLIGGASLDLDSFCAIIRAAAECAAGE
jgi:triosephosphate isomerase (TIM)